MEKRLKHRSSENRKPKRLPPTKKIRQTGRVRRREAISPAVTAACSPCLSPEALLLEISRETVMGIPPVPIVIKTEKTDSATWYNPNPSEPISRERTIRYKNPSARSATDRPVTSAAVR